MRRIYTSLDDLSLRKEELELELNIRKDAIVTNVKDIFAPPPAMNSSNAFVRNLGTGMVIFNGVKSGIKIVKVAKAFFKRFKK